VRKRGTPKSDLFTTSAEAEKVPSRRIHWKATYRLIPSRFPPIDLFERIAPKEDWHQLAALEGLTNPRLRADTGNINAVPPEKIVSGPGASIVMAPFTHHSPSRPSRFTDGTFGIYYAGHSFNTALLEVAFHMGRFHANTSDPALTDTYRSYKGSINKKMHDIRAGDYQHLLSADINDYSQPQAFARVLRNAESNGIVYPSVRHPGGGCIAAFWPTVVAIPVLDRHVQLRWDGTSMSQWFEYRTDDISGPPKWKPLPK
jgi:RES domain